MEKIDPVQPSPPPKTPIKIFYLNAVPAGGPAMMQVQIELAWPYKHMNARTCPASSTYDVEVLAYVKIHTAAKDSNGFNGQPPIAMNGYLPLTGTAKVPDFSTKNDDNQDECFKMVMVPLTGVGGVTTLDFVKSDGTVLLKAGDYVAGQDLLVSLVVFARVKQGSTYVDSAPQFVAWPHMIGNDDQEFAMMSPNKLYFQSDPRPFDPATVSVGPNGIELPYAWTSLEVPDPRFNYRAANWIQNTKDGAGIPNNGINPSTLALLGKEGRDGDVFMTVSNAGELLSPGELGFILRPFKYNAGSGTGVNFRNRTAVDPAVDDSDAYFRTIRLYDHSKTDPVDDMIRLTADPVFRYITAQNADGTVQGARVNPLSDIPLVLSAAIEQTPADYWFASKDFSANKSLLQANNFNKFLSTSDWRKFTNAWVSCLLNIPNVIQRPTPPNQPQRPAGSEMRTSWQYGLPDYYSRFDVFGWYSEGDSQTIFNPFGVKPKDVPGAPATLGTPLHEIDRKMLYSFSLEAFSDRQQLFLYILRAEVTVPSFGSSQESGTRSLAGGRAVALVWRDPYPEGYDKESDSWLYKNNSHWFSLLKRVSPWYQVNNKKYNTDLEENNVGGDPSITRRLDGYHQHRILYFKQLKN